MYKLTLPISCALLSMAMAAPSLAMTDLKTTTDRSVAADNLVAGKHCGGKGKHKYKKGNAYGHYRHYHHDRDDRWYESQNRQILPQAPNSYPTARGRVWVEGKCEMSFFGKICTEGRWEIRN
jgi:hypothetical protein